MNNIDGLIYLLNQSGLQLAGAEQQIAALTDENATLRAALAENAETGA